LIFRYRQRSFAPSGVTAVDAGALRQVFLSRQPVRSDRGSKGVTGNGRLSALWLCASKLVGGEDRQIRPLIHSEKRMKGRKADSTEPILQEKRLARSKATVPQTDAGRRVEHTKAIGRTLVKELGKLTP
jgi:hypothetical protein